MSASAQPAVLAERLVAHSPIARFELDTWRTMGFRAGITGREGEVDLGLFADGRAGAVMENWLAFGSLQRPEFWSLAVARQVHGAVIEEHDEATRGWHITDGKDAHLTAAPGLLLTVTVADCIPVYLAHVESRTVALLHAGWRGTAAGVLETGVRALMRRAACQTSEIVMHCGVGICGECYEVGSEVVLGVTGRRTSGPQRLDLRGVLADRAAQIGIRDVTVSTWCSSHDMDRFFSHRRSKGSDGRMLAYLGVPGVHS